MIAENENGKAEGVANEAHPNQSKRILKNKNTSQKDLLHKDKHEIWLAS